MVTPEKAQPKRFLGGYAEGVTPVPIPNTEVKPLRADGTARVAVWESRSPPGIKHQQPRFLKKRRGCFAFRHLGNIVVFTSKVMPARSRITV